jgi:hypothetical protein
MLLKALHLILSISLKQHCVTRFILELRFPKFVLQQKRHRHPIDSAVGPLRCTGSCFVGSRFCTDSTVLDYLVSIRERCRGGTGCGGSYGERAYGLGGAPREGESLRLQLLNLDPPSSHTRYRTYRTDEPRLPHSKRVRPQYQSRLYVQRLKIH